MNKKSNMLIVDDSSLNRFVLKKLFADEFEVFEAPDGATALKQLRELDGDVSIVLLDLIMPGKDGFAVIKEMHEEPMFSDIPVIVASAADGLDNELRALELGAIDYLPKPLEPRIIKLRVHNVLAGMENTRLTMRNEMLELGQYDELTGLFKKQAFSLATREMLIENPDEKYVMVLFDIDRFKLYNERHGMDEGDKLLKYIAEKVATRLGGVGKYARLHGDVFALCFKYTKESVQEMLDIADTSLGELTYGKELLVSFGLYVIDNRKLTVSQMLDRCDLALRTIKGNYMNRCAYFDDAMLSAMNEEQEILSEMKSALSQGQFDIYMQPKCRLDTGEISGAEALVRWIHTKRGLLMPSEFIPVFERNGFIMQLDTYVWECVCKAIRRWIDQGIPPMPVSVNISRINLRNPELCDVLFNLVKKYDIPSELLELEITESAYTEDPEQLLSVMRTLQQHGFIVLMDDFGSAYSSLNMLKDIPVDVLKIDLHFLSGTDTTGRGDSILASVVRMAQLLNLPVIAEGVETREQASFLRSIGCESAQGYYYYRPMPMTEYEKLARRATGIVKEDVSLAGKVDIESFLSMDKQISTLFNNVLGSVAIYEMHNDKLEVVRVNDEYLTMTGCSMEHFFGDNSNVLDWVHVSDREAAVFMFREARTEQRAATGRYRHRRADGSYIWVQTKVKFLTGNDTRSLFFAAITDVSNIMELEAKLLDDNKRYSFIRQALGDQLFDYDAIHDIFYYSQRDSDSELFSCSVQNFWYNFREYKNIHGLDQPKCLHAIERALHAPCKGIIEFRSKLTGEFSWYKMTYHAIADNSGYIARIVGRNEAVDAPSVEGGLDDYIKLDK